MSLLLALTRGGGTAVSPGVGSIALTGYAPTVVQGTAVSPGVGSIALTGYAPAIRQPIAVSPGVGSIALTGYAPAIQQPIAVSPGVGSIALAGYAPTIQQAGGSLSISVDVGQLTLTGYAPLIEQPVTGGASGKAKPMPAPFQRSKDRRKLHLPLQHTKAEAEPQIAYVSIPSSPTPLKPTPRVPATAMVESKSAETGEIFTESDLGELRALLLSVSSKTNAITAIDPIVTEMLRIAQLAEGDEETALMLMLLEFA